MVDAPPGAWDAAGVWPGAAASAASEPVLYESLPYQYLSGLLIGMGVGGVVGASTLGVAMFSLIAPAGQLREFTAVVPVVNVLANVASVSVYIKHADWSFCLRMWPYIIIGIGVGQLLLPLLAEAHLRRMTSVIYGLVLIQRFHEKWGEWRAARRLAAAKPAKSEVDEEAPAAAVHVANGNGNADRRDSGSPYPRRGGGSSKRDAAAAAATVAAARADFYNRPPVAAAVGLACGVITVCTNNSGPIFNIYLLACGLNMDQARYV